MKKTKQIKCIMCGTNYTIATDNRIPEFMVYAVGVYKDTFCTEFVFGKPEFKIVEKLLQQVDYKALCVYWEFFLNYPKDESGPSWYLRTSRRDLKGFATNINLVAQNCKISGQNDPSTQAHGTGTTPVDSVLEQMWDYLNTMLDGETAEYAEWAEKLKVVKNIEQLTRFNSLLQKHLSGQAG